MFYCGFEEGADCVYHGLVDEKSADQGGGDYEKDGSGKGQGMPPGDVEVQGVDGEVVEHPPVQEQDGEAVFAEHGDERAETVCLLRFFVQSQGEDAAGHEDGKWCHVHIIVDITLPVYIRVYGQHYLQEGQGCEDPDPPVVFPGLGAGYPVADHGNADPLGEEGQQVGGHKGVGFQEHTHKNDGRETGQRPVRHCFKHILEKWHGHIDGEGHVDQPQKRAIILDGAGQDAVEGFSECVSTYRIQPSVLPHVKEKVDD